MRLIILTRQAYLVVADDDEPAAVEVADGAFVGFFGNLETVGDELGRTVVTQLAAAVVLISLGRCSFSLLYSSVLRNASEHSSSKKVSSILQK